jgi:hypothetical protein
MSEPDYDELEKIKFHVLTRIPLNERGAILLVAVIVALIVCGLLAGVAHTAKLFGYDSELAVVIVGIGFSSGFAFTYAGMMQSRIEALQRHLIALHEDLLSAHSDIRQR